MLITNVPPPKPFPTGDVPTSVATQKVVIVNGSSQIVELLERVLAAGHYDVVFVESNDHAYSQIKRVQPHLVILCVHIDDVDGFQVLSMLKLDEATRRIPILTYTTEFEASADAEQEGDGEAETAAFPMPAVERMN